MPYSSDWGFPYIIDLIIGFLLGNYFHTSRYRLFRKFPIKMYFYVEILRGTTYAEELFHVVTNIMVWYGEYSNIYPQLNFRIESA